jgi:hypothetical protein
VAADKPAPAAEARIKAAFLYKFTGYVEWPAGAFGDPASPIVIGVAGSRPVLEELERAVGGRRIGERKLRVVRIPQAQRSCESCHVLFIGGALERERVEELLEGIHGKAVLSVTESAGEAPPHSVIHFVIDDRRVRFDISREAASRSGLRLAASLLSVARLVDGKAP